MSALFATGTLYSNSIKGDLATDRVIHGFQVFEQEGTGRESFIDPRNNILCGIELAERIRAEIIRDAAPELLSALEEITQRYAMLDTRLVAGQHNESNGTIERARAAIAKAKGV